MTRARLQLIGLLTVLSLSAAGCKKKEETTAPPTVTTPPPPSQELSPEASALIFDSPVHTLDGKPSSLASHRGKALLLVNVASRCGLTPQYEGLERLQKRYAARGFSPSRFMLTMSRTDIANYLRLAAESVSRVFRRFQDEGLLHVDRREIEILDRPRLEELARSILRE